MRLLLKFPFSWMANPQLTLFVENNNSNQKIKTNPPPPKATANSSLNLPAFQTAQRMVGLSLTSHCDPIIVTISPSGTTWDPGEGSGLNCTGYSRHRDTDGFSACRRDCQPCSLLNTPRSDPPHQDSHRAWGRGVSLGVL